MKNVVIDKGGFRYKWSVRGLNEPACVADIKENMRVELTDYIAIRFAEQYGCVAEVEKLRLMSHNQYQKFLQHNANRLHEDKNYTIEDYRRDADAVSILPFQLERFHLQGSIEEFVNARFDSISYTSSGDACLSGRIGSNVDINLLAEKLGCDLVCNQGYNGFFKNDSNRFILEFCEGDVTLIICASQKNYASQLAEFNRFYEIEDFDVCLEVYFDNVHMDNIFVPRDNVLMAISSILQKGYDGYDKGVKECWENLMRMKMSPSLGFRVVETPTMVRDIDAVLANATQRSISTNSTFGKEQEYAKD